jgi:hypothetical protein
MKEYKMQPEETLMTKKKFLYSRFTQSPLPPIHIVVKQHKNRRILYVTYRGGRKSGGGAWSENLANLHPRTLNMILEIFGEKTVEDLQKLTPSSDTKQSYKYHAAKNKNKTKDAR